MTRIDREGQKGHITFEDAEVDHLRALQSKYPTVDDAVAKIAELRGEMTLPKASIHIFSDVHGEYKKLRHVINNASGRLLPLVEERFGKELDAAARRELLNVVYYPQETLARKAAGLANREEHHAFVKKTLSLQLELFRFLGSGHTLRRMWSVLPEAFREVLWELLMAKSLERDERWVDAVYATLIEHEKGYELIRLVSRAIRNISVGELIVAGDLGDRGPRLDRVCEYVMRQPDVAITWGNHDISWMGACLGHDALIATVVRISLRYGQLAQLEEGYGIPLAPLEELARKVYGQDPGERFKPKASHLEDPLLVARMQKAIAVIQFKLEAELAARNPHFKVDDRQLLRAIDLAAGTVKLGGQSWPMLDKSFPTLDPAHPDRLTPDEILCIGRLRASFLESPTLWKHMSFLFQKGAMYLVRDHHLIFHGAVPVDEKGAYLEFPVDGVPVGGKQLFDSLESVVQRAWRRKDPAALDLLWYLWAGPLSPLFGKDKMATFEAYFIADKATHKETKNPYFKLIHERSFCDGVFKEFGVDPSHGLIVNGHVPVKVEQGESPVKRSGSAVTIDGAFSEAYGDRGYTLVLSADRTYIASHHHFESIDAAITEGADIVPQLADVIVHDRVRTVGDTDAGARAMREIETLERLIIAYEENVLEERRTG